MLMLGDCIDKLKTLRDCSVDAVVCDPPYGLSFMGKGWDHGVPGVEFWVEALRVAKPGAHLLAFGGTRTYHRLACAIEDAGWEIRDCVMWVYGSGFPKSLDVSKAIDKAAGVERERVQGPKSGGMLAVNSHNAGHGYRPNDYAENGNSLISGDPITGAARQWQGWGTALKPSLEPITVARKPLIGTVAENVLKHGTGGINVDACRVPHGDEVDLTAVQRQQAEGTGIAVGKGYVGSILGKEIPMYKPGGRWPANLIHDGSEVPTNLLGDAARFFYCAKASKADRDEGCEGLGVKDVHRCGAGLGEGIDPNAPAKNRNHHPTVKPTALMRYLCRLVTPPGGIVLDPFMGSGSTGKGAILEGFRFIGIERDPDYMQIAESRINHAQRTAMETKDVPHQLELEVSSA